MNNNFGTPMTKPDMDKFVAKIIALHGGRDRFIELAEQRVREFNAIWQQDADSIGRVLRAHLAVEHFLAEYITTSNPKLGSLDRARLSYSQKVELLPDDDVLMSALKPGFRRLNKIRNRLAHNLRVEVTTEDRDAFLAVGLFAAMRSESAKRGTPKPDDPLSTAEQFAMFAAGLLQAAAAPEADLWRQAILKEDPSAQQSLGGPQR